MNRCRVPELMDDPRLNGQAHAHALQSLNRVNRLLGVDRLLYARAEHLGLAPQMSCLDLGTGGGGFLQYLSRRSRHLNLRLMVGLDRSFFALGCARRWQGDGLQMVLADARHVPLADNSIDIVTCSLFLHHFDEADVVRILREAARIARRGVVVGDLHRSRPALVLTWLATRVLSRSRVFHVDGVRSVRAAFSGDELTDLAEEAGMIGARVERRFPYRLVLTWRKTGAADVSI